MKTTIHTRPAASLLDWRAEIPEHRRRHLRAWLWTGAALTFVILVIGGITRLTQSGLSIVDWDPIMGVIPPIGDAEWREAFARYQQFPEYQQLRQGMTLSEFKFIFFWEYVHRLAARLIGVAFLVPFLFFWARGYFNRPLLIRVLTLFGLGAMQGFMGWFMVSSGLVDDPRVSHYRLAAHLFVALSILSLCVWLIRDLSRPGTVGRDVGGREGRGGVYALGVLLLLQILWGAFVAGLDAGLIFNEFPKMGDGLVPPGAWEVSPVWVNVLENPATVQWVHRLLGTLLAAGATAVAIGAWRRDSDDSPARRLSALFAGLVLAQYAIGIATLVLAVPVSLGAIHQAVAVFILATWLIWLHHTRNAPAPARHGSV